MQNYYIIIEDMPSLVSHQLSIIMYVVLKKIFFFLCFDRLIWTWTWTWTRTSLDSDLTRTRTSLDLDLTRTRTSLDLDLSWTRQRWTWLQPYHGYISNLGCSCLTDHIVSYKTNSRYPERMGNIILLYFLNPNKTEQNVPKHLPPIPVKAWEGLYALVNDINLHWFW